MRRRRVMLVLALAMMSGLVAAYSALRFLQQRPDVIAETTTTTMVVVAARDLELGRIIKPEDLQLIAWPGEAIPQGYLSSIEDVTERGLVVSVNANEPILAAKLADRGVGGGLPIIIPSGMRALSISVNEIVGVAGFVTPGTRVDVLLTVSLPGAREPETKVVMQNVLALAAGQTIQRDEEGKPLTVSVVTVLVTPEDAEALVSAAGQGRIQLALRGWMDVEEIETNGTRVSAVMGSRPTRSRARVVRGGAAAPGNILEFYRAGVRTLISY
jgi:pilus assembly protein CpaB